MLDNLKACLSKLQVAPESSLHTRDLMFVLDMPSQSTPKEKDTVILARSSFYLQIKNTPGSNTLDNILIQYGHSLQNDETLESSRDLMFASDMPNGNMPVHENPKTQLTTLKEFLKIKPEKLSSEEQKLQQVLATLHRLNDRNPPLFQSFPNWRPNQPLTIDVSDMPNTDCHAVFYADENCIGFHKGMPQGTLLGMIAHELKHAEQCSEELYTKAYHNANHKESQELRFIEEVHAKAFDTYVTMLDAKERGALDEWENDMAEYAYFYGAIMPTVKKHYERDPELKDGIKLQEDLMIGLLPAAFHSDYKREYDENCPIREGETDAVFIPKSFHLSEKFVTSRLLPELKKIPSQDTGINPQNLYFLILDGKFDEATAVLNTEPSLKEYLIHPVVNALRKSNAQILGNYSKSNPDITQYISSKMMLETGTKQTGSSELNSDLSEHESPKKAVSTNTRNILRTGKNTLQAGG